MKNSGKCGVLRKSYICERQKNNKKLVRLTHNTPRYVF